MTPDEESRTVAVPGSTARLAARLHRPKEGARGGVVLAHPHPLQGGDMDNHVVKALQEDSAKRGLATLRFDFRHARAREPPADAALLADSEADLLAAAENLRTALPADAPLALAGYSFGGAVALRVAPRARAAAVGVVGLPVKWAIVEKNDWTAFNAHGAPALVMQGQYDEVGTPDDARALAQRTGAKLEVRPVPDASHGYFGEAGFVAKIVGGFLAKRL